MNFIIKINNCRESTFDVVAQRLLKMDVKILSVFIESGIRASLLGILCCEGDVNFSDLEDFKQELHNFIPPYKWAQLEKLKDTPLEYEKEKQRAINPIYIHILTGGQNG